MSNLSRWLWTLVILLAIRSAAFGQSAAAPVTPPAWPVTTAPARFTIEPDQPGPNRVSSVELYLPDPKWVTMPIRVFTDTGVAVGSDLLWSATGEPATLLFDSTSGAKRYRAYLGSSWPPLHLPDNKAGVFLEAREGDGKMINDLPGMLQAWNQSSKVLGRALFPSIFEGGNPFGPQANLFQHFQGWFDAAAPEHLQLAIISSDATFVLVDGKEVVEWPALHDFHAGLGGQHQGAVDLAVGAHSLDYYNAFVPGRDGHPVLCCLAAKGGTLSDWTMLMPSANFFRPVGHGHIVSYDLQANSPGAAGSGSAPRLAASWRVAGESVPEADLPDAGLVAITLTSLTAPADDILTWTFDDGTTQQGSEVTHLFLRPGLRKVQLALTRNGKETSSLTETISVHPDRLHPAAPHLDPAQSAAVLSLDPATISPSDLVGAFVVFAKFQNPAALLKLLPAVSTQLKNVSEPDVPYLKDAALYLVHEDWTHLAEEMQLLRALSDRVSQEAPSPPSIALSGEIHLALARLIFKTSDNLDGVKSMVAAIDPSSLSDEERRVLAILKADLVLASGDVAGAKKQYQALTGEPTGPDARSSIRRTAKIGQARAYLDQRDFGAAEDALNEVAWNAPIEKISSDWALTRLRAYQAENLPVVAYLWAKRLLPVITDSGRSELLFRVTDLAFAQGDNALAQKSLSELLKKHPYSEEAAQAKQKWPGQG